VRHNAYGDIGIMKIAADETLKFNLTAPVNFTTTRVRLPDFHAME
jgi:hypothetical protein